MTFTFEPIILMERFATNVTAAWPLDYPFVGKTKATPYSKFRRSAIKHLMPLLERIDEASPSAYESHRYYRKNFHDPVQGAALIILHAHGLLARYPGFWWITERGKIALAIYRGKQKRAASKITTSYGDLAEQSVLRQPSPQVSDPV